MVAGNQFIRTKAKTLDKFSIDFTKTQKAKIKSNTDLTHNGKLLVWLVDSNTNENLEENWISVNYASPFAGCTDREEVSRQAIKSYEGTQKSYGFFAVPPDKNNYVLITFVNGDPTQGFWFACIQQDMQTAMIPGIGQNKTYNNGTAPAAEVNIYSGQIGAPQVNPTRPTYTPLFNGLTTQGLINDTLRGAGTSSVWRDTTPTVYGLLTPGGNQLIMDDGSNSKMIRLRTQSGAQLLISETDGSIYAINKSGTGYLELNNSGNIYGYCSGSYNIRADKDINFSAGNNINLNAGNNVNVLTNNKINLQSKNSDLNVNFSSGKIYMTAIDIYMNDDSHRAGNASSPSITPTHEPFTRPS